MNDPFFLTSPDHPSVFVRVKSNRTPLANVKRIIWVISAVGSEYGRMQVLLKDWTDRASEIGYGVIHFDLPGTGQSSGHLESTELDHWKKAIRSVLKWIREQNDFASVDGVAPRWAALWLSQTLQSEDGMRHLYLWNPIKDARKRFQMEQQMNRDWHAHPIDPGKEGILGEIWNPKLVSELSQLEFEPRRMQGARRVISLSCDESEVDVLNNTASNEFTALYQSYQTPEKHSWDDWQSAEQIIHSSNTGEWLLKHLKDHYGTT